MVKERMGQTRRNGRIMRKRRKRCCKQEEWAEKETESGRMTKEKGGK